MTGSHGRGIAGWQMTARVAGGEGRRGVSLRMLAARFPGFAFGTRKMRDHVAFEAVREDLDAPGVTVVITGDLGEMRQALLEDQDSPPAGGGLPPDPGG